MTEFDDILGRVKDKGYRRVKTVELFDPRLIERHSELELELQSAVQDDVKHNRTPTAPKLAEQIRKLEAEIEASALAFKFGAVSSREWSDLLAANPPTKKQLKDVADRATDWRHRPVLDHNPDTFPAAVVAASAIDPEMTAEQVAALAEELGPDQFELLWSAAYEVNRGGESAPKSLAAGVILQVNGQSESTPALEGSLAASS